MKSLQRVYRRNSKPFAHWQLDGDVASASPTQLGVICFHER
jgi:hypothetical protein